jgi:FkbM family methyltransferase
MRALPPLRRTFVARALFRAFAPVPESAEGPLDGGGRMKVFMGDWVGFCIHMRGCYQREVVKALREHLKSGMTFFDVGAHYGQNTVIGSRLVGDQGVVHSFEPGAHQSSYLDENVRLNALSNVTVHRVAVSNRVGTASFDEHEPADAAGSRLIQGGNGGREVPVTTLDAHCEERGIGAIDVLKVDVEEHELAVFEGARGLLGKGSPRVIVYECLNGYGDLRAHDLLASYGYRILALSHRRQVPVSAPWNCPYNDFIAIRPAN